MQWDGFSISLKDPGDWDPLWILRDCLQGGLDCAVGLIQVVVDDGEVKVVAVGCLYFSALVARPVQFFILGQKTGLALIFCDFICIQRNLYTVAHVYVCKKGLLTVSVLATTPASTAEWFIALSTSYSGDWRNTTYGKNSEVLRTLRV